ncbi:hypothetical protein CI610_00429 [invertebrate metagenome]|uniref:Uncharacterized protein n=1 Tax=invertebrate metagenome TaxID=1711999 RepID=A0A2H9TBG7_9ZZZZ
MKQLLSLLFVIGYIYSTFAGCVNGRKPSNTHQLFNNYCYFKLTAFKGSICLNNGKWDTDLLLFFIEPLQQFALLATPPMTPEKFSEDYPPIDKIAFAALEDKEHNTTMLFPDQYIQVHFTNFPYPEIVDNTDDSIYFFLLLTEDYSYFLKRKVESRLTKNS